MQQTQFPGITRWLTVPKILPATLALSGLSRDTVVIENLPPFHLTEVVLSPAYIPYCRGPRIALVRRIGGCCTGSRLVDELLDHVLQAEVEVDFYGGPVVVAEKRSKST